MKPSSHFRPQDQQWLRNWLDWTDANRATLRRLRPIIGPPVLGRVDGTAAIAGDRGFVFLFNPNYRELPAEFTLDASIGLTRGDTFLLRELYPRAGRCWGKSGAGLWRLGDRASLPIKGPEALVLEVIPADSVARPLLLGATGEARLDGQSLVLSNVTGAAGCVESLSVLLPPGRKPATVSVNGRRSLPFLRQGDLITVPVTFAGVRVDHCPQILASQRDFAGTVVRTDFSIPRQVFAQLAERRKAWPVPYTSEELLATWRGSDRLLLYVHIADPKDTWTVELKIDGRPVAVRRAYSDVFPLGRERTFTGFYADISQLKPDARHELEVKLPDGLQPGQFQGVFLENVEAELTAELNETAGGNALHGLKASLHTETSVVPRPDISQIESPLSGQSSAAGPQPLHPVADGCGEASRMAAQAIGTSSGRLHRPHGRGEREPEQERQRLAESLRQGRMFLGRGALLAPRLHVDGLPAGGPQLIREARLWLEPSIVGQRSNGYFGTEAIAGNGKDAPDLMPHQNMLYAYRAYYDATGDRRVLDLMSRYFHWELTLDDRKFFNGGWALRGTATTWTWSIGFTIAPAIPSSWNWERS